MSSLVQKRSFNGAAGGGARGCGVRGGAGDDGGACGGGTDGGGRNGGSSGGKPGGSEGALVLLTVPPLPSSTGEPGSGSTVMFVLGMTNIVRITTPMMAANRRKNAPITTGRVRTPLSGVTPRG
jgi:hypothetical protein